MNTNSKVFSILGTPHFLAAGLLFVSSILTIIELVILLLFYTMKPGLIAILIPIFLPVILGLGIIRKNRLAIGITYLWLAWVAFTAYIFFNSFFKSPLSANSFLNTGIVFTFIKILLFIGVFISLLRLRIQESKELTKSFETAN